MSISSERLVGIATGLNSPDSFRVLACWQRCVANAIDFAARSIANRPLIHEYHASVSFALTPPNLGGALE
jgi:hypothetical protein